MGSCLATWEIGVKPRLISMRIFIPNIPSPTKQRERFVTESDMILHKEVAMASFKRVMR